MFSGFEKIIQFYEDANTNLHELHWKAGWGGYHWAEKPFTKWGKITNL